MSPNRELAPPLDHRLPRNRVGQPYIAAGRSRRVRPVGRRADARPGDGPGRSERTPPERRPTPTDQERQRSASTPDLSGRDCLRRRLTPTCQRWPRRAGALSSGGLSPNRYGAAHSGTSKSAGWGDGRFERLGVRAVDREAVGEDADGSLLRRARRRGSRGLLRRRWEADGEWAGLGAELLGLEREAES